MLWEIVSKALLKSRWTTAMAFTSSSEQAALSWKEIRLVKQDLPSINPYCLGLISRLSYPWRHSGWSVPHPSLAQRSDWGTLRHPTSRPSCRLASHLLSSSQLEPSWLSMTAGKWQKVAQWALLPAPSVSSETKGDLKDCPLEDSQTVSKTGQSLPYRSPRWH